VRLWEQSITTDIHTITAIITITTMRTVALLPKTASG
jgi:hypothetical protein